MACGIPPQHFPLTAPEGCLGSGNDLGRLRQRRLFKVARIRYWHLLAAHAANRRVQLPEGLLDNTRTDFGS